MDCMTAFFRTGTAAGLAPCLTRQPGSQSTNTPEALP